jgi:hypothetical protein
MRWIFFIIVLVKGSVIMAQSLPDLKPLRYNEDYTFLEKDSSRTWYKRFKYLPVIPSRKTYLSFGGEVRYQYFNVENEDWGDAPDDGDGYILSRFLLHADVHVSDHVRTFIQWQGSGANGRNNASAVDENPLDIHQAFVDITFRKLKFRAGRQELSYGSQRLVSVRELPNNRQAFDGLKISFTHKGNHTDIFYTHYTMARSGIFDDAVRDNVKLWGMYFTNHTTGYTLDLYYLGLEKKQASFDDGTGREVRHSFGSRLEGTLEDFHADLEGVYQLGSLGDHVIRAWTISLNSIYTINDFKIPVELGVKGELISGDRHYGDGVLGTFNPLFPRGAYFGLAALIGPSNLIDIHPSLSIHLSDNVEYGIDYDVFWRYARHDGVYAPNVVMIYSGEGINNRFIGNQLGTDIQVDINNQWSLKAEFTWFDAGAFLRQAGAGEDIYFAGLTSQFKF